MSMKLFALNSSLSFGKEVAKLLHTPLASCDEYEFDDGECYCASRENVRGRDIFVIQSLYEDDKESVSDKLMKLLVFSGALHDASAKRIVLVTPYLAFARQDRKIESRAPITTKYIARLVKSVWADRVLALDVHNPTAIQNAHHLPVDLLEATNLFAVYVKSVLKNHYPDMNYSEKVVAFSPDSGGLGRTRKFRSALADVLHCDVGLACLDKVHSGFEIRGHGIMGDVKGKIVVIYDDLISSGKTALECIQASEQRGAEAAFLCASHGLFVGKANEYLSHPFLKKIFVTDTVAPFRITNENVLSKLNIIKTTHLFAEAIKRIHDNDSISDLIRNHKSEPMSLESYFG